MSDGDGDNNALDDATIDLPNPHGFIFGSSDSWHSFNAPSGRPVIPNTGEPPCPADLKDTGDFLSTITTISQVYRRGEYLEMPSLDKVSWDYLDGGRIFSVSQSVLRYKTPGALNQRRSVVSTNKIVIKKSKRDDMTTDDYRSFNRELRILNHMKGSSNIVTLRGVGWFYHYDSPRPVPQPVIMLEQAHCTMHRLIAPSASLNIKTMMSVCKDVANGLSALHECGIAHGDIKPDNVLLFLAPERFDDGVPVETFTAKISDFNLSVLDTGKPKRFLGGTKWYMAPEHERLLTFTQMKLCDVFSLGMLYAAVASESEEFNDIPSSLIDLYDTRQEVYSDLFLKKIDTITEGSVMEPSLLRLSRCLFSCTLRIEPTERSLEQLLDSFDQYIPPSITGARTLKPNVVPSNSSDLMIAYGDMKHLSGAVKDHVSKELNQIIASGFGVKNPRYSKALFERGIIALSKFATPTPSKKEGLQDIYDSAVSGDPRAQTLYARLSAASGLECGAQYHKHRLEWLFNAASAGSQPALADLSALNREAAQRARVSFAAECISRTFTGDDMASKNTVSNGKQILLRTLHYFAATGQCEELAVLMRSHACLKDSPNPHGDTPLLSALRFGQLNTALLLLELGADASIVNSAGENGIHLLWNFTIDEARALLPLLLSQGASPTQQSTNNYPIYGWDLAPIIAGSPLERLAGRNRLDLVKLLLEYGLGPQPQNGNQVRRMLLLAIRLQHTDIQGFMVEYASSGRPGFLSGLRELGDVIWYYKGRGRSYVDAAIVGWVRQTGSGLDLPVSLWQACYHGADHTRALTESIQRSISLPTKEDSDRESRIDRAIVLSLSEHAYDAFRILFNTKVIETDGSHARSTSLKTLRWTHERPVLIVNFIDQVFCAKNGATLAQQALWRGDRELFHLAMHEYGANLTLPFYETNASAETQMNGYAALSYTDHHDEWFCTELMTSGIGLSCPFDSDQLTAPNGSWRSPLHHALKNRSWRLCDWLIEKGKSPFRCEEDGKPPIAPLLIPGEQPGGLLDYLFPQEEGGKCVNWCITRELECSGGYKLFRHLYNVIKPGQITVMSLQTELHTNQPSPQRAVPETSHHGPRNCFAEQPNSGDQGSGEEMSRNEELIVELNQRSLDVPKSTASMDAAARLVDIATQADAMLKCWLYLLECFPATINQPRHKDKSVLSMTRKLCQKLSHFSEEAAEFHILILPTIMVSITIPLVKQAVHSYEQASRLSISIARDRCAPKMQSLFGALRSVIRGSPLDDLYRSEFRASKLLRYGYFPSLRHSWIWNPIQFVPFFPPISLGVGLLTLLISIIFMGNVVYFAFFVLASVILLGLWMLYIVILALVFLSPPVATVTMVYWLLYFACKKIHARTGKDIWPYIEFALHGKWMGKGDDVLLWLPE